MSAGWIVVEPEQSEDQHVVPVMDLIDHRPTDCACGPRTEAVPREDGSMGWLVVHHSLDGREADEPDHKGEHVPQEMA